GFQVPRQSIHAQENGEVPVIVLVLVDGFGNAAGDVLGFIQAGFVADDRDQLAARLFGVQVLGFSLAVVGDQGAGSVPDRFGATGIALQCDDTGSGKIALEIQDVADVRAAPFVDRLVRIADNAQVRLIDGQAAGDGVLGLVGVLIFINEDVAKAGIELGSHLL